MVELIKVTKGAKMESIQSSTTPGYQWECNKLTARLSSKSRRTEVIFHLTKLLYAFSLEMHPFEPLKSVKGGLACILGRCVMVML